MYCTSGRHQWEKAEDAIRCCNGYLVTWVKSEDKEYQRELLPEDEARGIPRFGPPGAVLPISSAMGTDKLMEDAPHHPQRFWDDVAKHGLNVQQDADGKMQLLL